MFEIEKAGNEMGGVCGECGKHIAATEHLCDECCEALDDAYREAFEHVG